MEYKDIENVVLNLFHSQNTPTHRYASFDYCFNFFQNSTANELKQDIEKSCLQLAFYLASWGMLRGSSFLLQKSTKHYEPLIRYFIELKELNHNIWRIDINNYTDENITRVIDVYKTIQKLFISDETNNRHLVLVTKIMLGVFECIPAYDRYFTNTFKEIFKTRCGFTTVNKESLLCLKEFYEFNSSSLDKLQSNIQTIDFTTGNQTSIKYTKAKIIDMYGFAKAMN